MTISKVKSLFSRSQYPLHYGWLELLATAIDGPIIKQSILDETTSIARLMGDDYVSVLKSMIDGDPNLIGQFLPLKITAKKRIATIGFEFAEDCDKITALLSKHVTLGVKPPHKQLEEQQQAHQKLLQERRASSQKMFAKLQTRHEKEYIDYPDLDIVKIRRHSKAASILDILIKGKISDADFFWLKQKGFVNNLVTSMYYLHRAEAAKRTWINSNKPWSLVNALADYRKAHKPRLALALVNRHFPFKFANGNNKLKSALLTTTGGVKRDLDMFVEAIELGIKAHELTHQNYRPCTLIGACKMLSGDIAQGHDWYQKAISRGFEPDSYEQELRSIYSRASAKDKAKIRNTLMEDGWSYQWLK